MSRFLVLSCSDRVVQTLSYRLLFIIFIHLFTVNSRHLVTNDIMHAISPPNVQNNGLGPNFMADIPEDAVQAGFDAAGYAIFIGFVEYNNNRLFCQMIPGKNYRSIIYGGCEIAVKHSEVSGLTNYKIT